MSDITGLGNATEESRARMQSSLDKLYVFALGIFEPGNYEQELIDKKIFEGEKRLQQLWTEKINSVLGKANLIIPPGANETKEYGGRKGYHTDHLQPLLNEMSEVISTDSGIEW